MSNSINPFLKKETKQKTVLSVTGDGYITIDELATVMRSLGQDPTPQELHKMLDDASFNDQESYDDIEITFTQFCSLMV